MDGRIGYTNVCCAVILDMPELPLMFVNDPDIVRQPFLLWNSITTTTTTIHLTLETGSKCTRNFVPVAAASFSSVPVDGFDRPLSRRAMALWLVPMRSASSA
jgi:hypothetical protein